MTHRPTIAHLFARLVALLGVLAVLTPLAEAQVPDYEHKYEVEMAGQTAGEMTVRQQTEGDEITTTMSMRFELNRGATGLTISMGSEFVETARGEPVRMVTEQALGTMPTSITYVWEDDGIRVVSSQGGQAITSRLPLPEGSWLTPSAAAAYVKARLAAGADSITVRTIEPTAGPTPIVVTRSDFEPATIEIEGEAVAVTKCRATSSASPGAASTEFIDAAGMPVRSEIAMGGIRVVMTRTSRDVVVAGELAPELMVSTFVSPDRPIKNPRGTRRAIYRLTANEGERPSLPGTNVQHVKPDGDDAVRVLVDMNQRTAADPGDINNADFLAATSVCNHGDELIVSLTAGAIEGVVGQVEQAEALRRFVHRYINAKNLGVGFATASEVARTRSGDCTEHGVLLAAMLRAAGIPSRTAAGLVYADQFAGAEKVFAYHMWTQALLPIGDTMTWVDLDATLPDRTPFDATHIALGLSDLGDGAMDAGFMSIASLLGTLKVEVETLEWAD